MRPRAGRVAEAPPRSSSRTASSRSAASSVDLEVGVARDAEEAHSTISICVNSRGRKWRITARAGRGSRGCRPQEPREQLRHLDACEALVARIGVAHEDAEAEREPGDVRERLAMPDAERRQHREHVRVEEPLELEHLLLVEVLDRATMIPASASAGRSSRFHSRDWRAVSSSTRARISASASSGVRPSGERTEETGLRLLGEARDAHHEEVVQVGREELHTFTRSSSGRPGPRPARARVRRTRARRARD